MGYIFDTSKGETPETLKRKRDIVRALMGAQRAPQNVGEGLSALGDGIVANVLGSRADAAEKAGMDSASTAMGPLSMMFGGGAEAAGGAPATAPYTTSGGGGSAGPASDMDGNAVYSEFMDTIKKGGVTNPNALAAIAATGKSESGFSPGNAFRAWSDPSESGGAGQAGGIMSWRAERLENMRRFAAANGGDPSRPSPALQAQFLLKEDPSLIASLSQAKSPEEAQQMMNNAWKFAGYDRPGGEAGRRIALARNFAGKFQQQPGEVAPTQVASLDPSVGLPPEAAAGAQKAVPSPELITSLAEEGIAADSPQAQAFASIGAGGSQPQPPQPAGLPVPANPAASPVVQALTGAPQQVAQAELGGGQGAGPFPAAPPDPNSGEGRIRQILAAAQNPWLSDSQQAVVKALLGEEMQKRDPAYKMELEKSQLELENLRNPKMSPGDAAQLDFNKQKFEADQRAAAEKAAADAEKLKFDQGDTTADNTRADKEFEQKQKEAGLTDDIKEYNTYARDEVNAGRVPLGRLQYAQELKKAGASNTNVSVDSGMKLTEGQSKDIGFFSRGLAANDALAEREQELTSLAGNVAGQFGVPGNYYKDPKYRQAERDGREVLAVILRKDTGAAVTPAEFELYGPMYLPWPGDDAATVADKREARDRALRGMELGLGTAAPLAKDVREKFAAEKEAKKRKAPAATSKPVSEMTDEELQAIINGQ